jgi:hypothetical protein
MFGGNDSTRNASSMTSLIAKFVVDCVVIMIAIGLGKLGATWIERTYETGDALGLTSLRRSSSQRSFSSPTGSSSKGTSCREMAGLRM